MHKLLQLGNSVINKNSTTDSEKISLAKIGKENYVDINIYEEKVISLTSISNKKP